MSKLSNPERRCWCKHQLKDHEQDSDAVQFCDACYYGDESRNHRNAFHLFRLDNLEYLREKYEQRKKG